MKKVTIIIEYKEGQKMPAFRTDAEFFGGSISSIEFDSNIHEAPKSFDHVFSGSYNELLEKSIDIFEMSCRAANTLKAGNIYYIGDLVQKTEVELLKLDNLGRETVREVKLSLRAYKLTLGTTLTNWPPKSLVK